VSKQVPRGSAAPFAFPDRVTDNSLSHPHMLSIWLARIGTVGCFICFFLDLGKVLAGIQAPEEDSAQFGEFLRELGYPYVEETHNEVYRRYLRK